MTDEKTPEQIAAEKAAADAAVKRKGYNQQTGEFVV